MSDDLVKRYRQLQEVIGGCHDGYCVVRKPKGMHTNGGCNCLEDLRLHERSRIGGLLRCAQGMADRIEELEAKLSESEALLEKAEVEKLDAIDTLDAWFDRRKLAHDAIDQAVVDAASGYLRTSRVGGMSQKKSDLVLGVIQDMARLSVFADLFARTTLAELTGGKDE